VTKAGECEKCPDFEIATEDQRGCERPKCGPREYILKDGTCDTCDDYEMTISDKLKCER